MSEPRRTETWLMAGIVVVLAAALGFISWSAVSIRQRQIELSDLSLERLQQLIAVRLDATFEALGTDLREEADFIDGMDRLDTAAVIARWRSLMRTHRTITAVKLADEMGGELSLVQDTAGAALALLPRKTGALHPTTDVYDPRQRVWFSKALEDQRGEVTWTLRPGTEGKHPRMQCSQLLRPRTAGEVFHILMFEVDLGRSTWPKARSRASPYGAILMDSEGGLLIGGAPDRDRTLQLAEAASVSAWLANRTTSPFTVGSNKRSYRALVSAYNLNGETLYTGALLDTSLIAMWTSSERRELAVMGALLILLTLLLLRSWMVRRHETLRMEHEARRSLSQEQQLAKAIEEREVLNREVHHRVKNNLQVVSSLLNLQAAGLADGAVRDEFLRGKRRIDIIALVHHRLYALKDLRNVQLKGFFGSLIEHIAQLHEPGSRSISHEVITNELSVDQDTAIELGIILCELMANCYQHAFPYPTGGHIDVVVQNVEGDLHRLVVKDNGRGLPDGHTGGPGKLGLDIVGALAEQLDGSFHVRSNGGVTFEVLFRMRR